MKIIVYILSIVVSLSFSGQGFSKEKDTEEQFFRENQGEVKLVIADQIAAFNSQNVDRAYFHASRSIKAIFPSSEIFGTMVKNSYPMIWNPKSYEFLSTFRASDGMLQRVMFKDQSNDMHFFDYVLENNGERWVISGVYMVQGEAGA